MQLPCRVIFAVRENSQRSFASYNGKPIGVSCFGSTRKSCKEADMEFGKIAFTAVYLKGDHGYVGFIEELPGVNSHGRTLDEARDTLRKLAEVVFDEERRGVEEMIAGKDVVRENFVLPLPRH
jgi:predicted RNase H-like HicB family nuclease